MKRVIANILGFRYLLLFFVVLTRRWPRRIAKAMGMLNKE